MAVAAVERFDGSLAEIELNGINAYTVNVGNSSQLDRGWNAGWRFGVF